MLKRVSWAGQAILDLLEDDLDAAVDNELKLGRVGQAKGRRRAERQPAVSAAFSR